MRNKSLELLFQEELARQNAGRQKGEVKITKEQFEDRQKEINNPGREKALSELDKLFKK